MATVKFLGEGPGGAQENVWRDYTFKVGESVEIDDPAFLAKASKNPHFEVTGYDPPEEPKDKVAVTPKVTEASAQYPVEKPGEPVDLAKEQPAKKKEPSEVEGEAPTKWPKI